MKVTHVTEAHCVASAWSTCWSTRLWCGAHIRDRERSTWVHLSALGGTLPWLELFLSFFFFFFLPFGGPFPSCSMSLTGHLQLFFLPHNDPYEHNGIQTAAPDHNKVRMPRWTSNSTFPSVCACTRTFCLLPLFIYLFVYSTSFRLWGITRTSGSLLCEITHANGTKTRFCYRKSDSRAITA